MHYDLKLELDVYETCEITAKNIATILAALNDIVNGKIRMRLEYSDGWEKLDITIQKQK